MYTYLKTCQIKIMHIVASCPIWLNYLEGLIHVYSFNILSIKKILLILIKIKKFN